MTTLNRHQVAVLATINTAGKPLTPPEIVRMTKDVKLTMTTVGVHLTVLENARCVESIRPATPSLSMPREMFRLTDHGTHVLSFSQRN